MHSPKSGAWLRARGGATSTSSVAIDQYAEAALGNREFFLLTPGAVMILKKVRDRVPCRNDVRRALAFEWFNR
jgi:hypothetical protein